MIRAGDEASVEVRKQAFNTSPLRFMHQAIDMVEVIKHASAVRAIKEIHAGKSAKADIQPWPVVVTFQDADGRTFRCTWQLENDITQGRIRIIQAGRMVELKDGDVRTSPS